ncbi:MAG: (2Fe-2S)-binding protein [Sporichthyaceae bacterium]
MANPEQALAAAAQAGPFYELWTEEPAPSGEMPWHPFAGLVGGDLLTARVAAVTAVLGERARVPAADIDARAAASLVHLGLVARLVSPTLAAAVLGGALLHVETAGLYWRDVLGPVPLTHPHVESTAVDPNDHAAVAAFLGAALAEGPVADLTEAVARLGVSRRVLWGNVASSFAAAATGLVRAGPDSAVRVSAVARATLARDPLAGHGEFAPGRGFVRTSCCLYYRVPGGGYCGDCVLAD